MLRLPNFSRMPRFPTADLALLIKLLQRVLHLFAPPLNSLAW